MPVPPNGVNKTVPIVLLTWQTSTKRMAKPRKVSV